MNKKLIQITGAIKKSFRFLFFTAMLSSFINAQTVSNLERFYSVIDSASSLLINDLGNSREVKLELNLGAYYSVFANQIRGKLLRNGVKIITDDSSRSDKINVSFVVDECNVLYSKPERDGLFGDYYTERTITASGNYYISKNPAIKNFDIQIKDKVEVDDVSRLENRSYPFTLGDLPAEPFFSSLCEPIIAITAAAITIMLFFSVRSK
jgi:hypothetical protein